jgi:hypothetical protein
VQKFLPVRRFASAICTLIAWHILCGNGFRRKITMRVPFKLIEASRNAVPSAEFEPARKKTTLVPEQELMCAVLEDAIACYRNHLLAASASGKILFREAEEWIFTKQRDWVFSFENICEVLALNPGYVRRGLLRLKNGVLGSRPKAKIYSLPARENLNIPPPQFEHAGGCAVCVAKKQSYAQMKEA